MTKKAYIHPNMIFLDLMDGKEGFNFTKSEIDFSARLYTSLLFPVACEQLASSLVESNLVSCRSTHPVYHSRIGTGKN
jgi:hypothetical protein